MKRQYIMITAALAMAMGLASCGTMFLEGGASAPVYTSTVYDAGYGTGYDANYSHYGIGYEDARKQAWYLSDKMAYELGLSDAQFEAIYEINLDYLLNMQSESSIYGDYWYRRNSDMFYVLDARQYNYFVNMDYFYRPVYWYDNSFAFSIYNRYENPRYYYRSRPVYYDTYRGGRNRQRDSYYAGRFGHRNGQPIVTNRMGNHQGYGNGGSRTIITTPQNSNSGFNGSTQGRPTFGNQQRGTTGVVGSGMNRPNTYNGNSTVNARPSTVQSQRSTGSSDSRFGGSRGGQTTTTHQTTTQPTQNRGSFGNANSRPSNFNHRSFPSGSSTRQSTPANSNRPSFGSGSTRNVQPTPSSTPAPRSTSTSGTTNRGSFGGHR